MSDTCKYNCSAHPTEISAYGDISGIGVTAAFFATAWIVVLLLIGYYLVAYNPELDPFRQSGTKTPCQYPNAIDYVFLYTVRKFPGLRSLQYSVWLQSSQLESALNKSVITFADIQIFTGLAVMISGYIALSCGLQSYHWQLAVYLVWLASLTHLAALSFLRNHLANNPGPRTWRLIAMSMMLVFLVVAVGLAGHFDWDDNGSNKASDFAVCYFGEKIDTKSVAFESMIKTLVLLAYGFFIRLAKMSRAFEGMIRGFPARQSAKAMRAQRGGGGFQPWDPRDSSGLVPSRIPHVFFSFLIAWRSLLSIHINLLTSFLAEVYWLTLSALWVTRRYFKTRLLGPKEEDEWTFGQVLPVLLVVAPLAAILEHFVPFQAWTNRGRRRPSPIALLMMDQLERDEAQHNILVDMDREHVHSIAYSGALLLAVVAYIEVGIFFVADESPGIRQPFSRYGVSFFILNPMLQFLWIHCTLWIPFLPRSNHTKRTIRWVVFGAFMSITVNEFLEAPTKGSGNRSVRGELGYGIYTTVMAWACSFLLPILNLWKVSKWSFSSLGAISLLICLGFPCAAGPTIIWGSIGELMYIVGICLCLELAWQYFEWSMEKFDIPPKRVACLRCAVLLCMLSVLGVLQRKTSVGPGTAVLAGSITVSGVVWTSIGIIASLIGGKRTPTQADDEASTT